MNTSPSRSIALIVEGPKACFRREEFSRHFVTYDVLPPLTASRILTSVLSHQALDVRLRRLVVRNPIRLVWETITTARGSRRVLVLEDVSYIIEAECRDHEADLRDIYSVAEKTTSVHFGLPEFAASVRLLSENEAVPDARQGGEPVDLGWLPYASRMHGQPGITFLRTSMSNGVIDLDLPRERMMLAR